MQMVAASKLRGADARLMAGRPFTGAFKDLFGALEKSEENPEGVEFAPTTNCVMPITSDKGLCGGVNTQIVKLTRLQVIPDLEEKGQTVSLVCVGDKGRSVLRRNNPQHLAAVVTQVFANVAPNFSVAACIAEQALETEAEGTEEDPFQKFETEDERSEVLESLAEFNLAASIYGAMLENNTSEIASRMAAMDNATRNANDMFSALELIQQGPSGFHYHRVD